MKMRSVCDIKFFVTGHHKQVDQILGFGCATVDRKLGVAETSTYTVMRNRMKIVHEILYFSLGILQLYVIGLH